MNHCKLIKLTFLRLTFLSYLSITFCEDDRLSWQRWKWR